MITFSAKDATETLAVSWDFTAMLSPGESLSGAPSVSVTLVCGTDPAPGAILQGSLQGAGNIMSQMVTGGVYGCGYAIAVTSATSNSRTLTVGAVLFIKPSWMFA